MSNQSTPLTKNIIHKLAAELMFELSDEQCTNLLKEFDAIEQQMKIVKEIETHDIEPLNYPLSLINSYLRLDVMHEPLTTKQVLENAPKADNDYIIINQVINHEN